MTNVLVVSEVFWPEGSGGELATYMYLKKISNINFTLLTGTPYENIPEDIKSKNNIEIVYMPWLREKHRVNLWIKLMRNRDFLTKLIVKHDIVYITREALPVMKMAKQIAQEIKVIYHLHGYMPLSYNSIIIAPYERTQKFTFKYSVYTTLKNNFVSGLIATLLGGFLTWYSRRLLEYADTIVCVSKRQRHIIASTLPDLGRKTICIYNPIPDDILIDTKEPGNTPSLIYVGGSSFIKGFDLLQLLLHIISEERLDLNIYILGHFTRDILKKLLDRYSKDQIKILGKIAHEKMRRIYRKTWALFFPAITEEPLPYAVLEAMATGTIPLASSVGGIPELVHGTSAESFLYNPYSPKEIIDKVFRRVKLDRREVKRISDEIMRKIFTKMRTHDPVGRLYRVFIER